MIFTALPCSSRDFGPGISAADQAGNLLQIHLRPRDVDARGSRGSLPYRLCLCHYDASLISTIAR